MKSLNQLRKNKYFIMIVFLTIIFGMHFFFEFSGDDTAYFSSVLDSYTLKDFLISRYSGWSSRLIIETVLVLVSRNIYLWRILDTCVIGLLVYSLNKIFFRESNYKNVLVTCLLFLLFPMNDMRQAGFAATTTNYLWCFSFMIFSFIPFRNIYYNENINKKCIPFYIMSLIYACNQEQAVCIVIMISVAFFIECLKKKLDYRYVIVYLVIAIVTLIFILTCPGNGVRSAIETSNYYPEYINLNVLDKIYIGLISTLSLMGNNMFVLCFFSFTVLLFLCKVKNKKTNLILGTSIFILITVFVLLRMYMIITNTDSILFNYKTTTSDVFDIKLMLLGILFIGVFVYLLWTLFPKKSISIIGLLLIGGASRVMMGFSPTVFASGTRTMIFLYFSLLIITMLLYKEYYTRLNKKELHIILGIMLILIVLNYTRLFVAII